MTRIFYLVLMLLTAAAAAVQWMPRDGFPPDIDLGPEEARAEAGPPARPQATGAITDVRRVTTTPNNGPTTIYPSAQPPTAPTATSAYPVTQYPVTETPNSQFPSAPQPTAPYPNSPYPNSQYSNSQYVGGPNPATPVPAARQPAGAVYPATSYPGAPTQPIPTNPRVVSPTALIPTVVNPSAINASPTYTAPGGAYPANPPPPVANVPPAAYPTTQNPTANGFDPFATPGAAGTTIQEATRAISGPTGDVIHSGKVDAAVNSYITRQGAEYAGPPPAGATPAPVNRPAVPAAVYPMPNGFAPVAPPGAPARTNPSPAPTGPAPMNPAPPAGGYSTTGSPGASAAPPPLSTAGISSFQSNPEQELEGTKVLARVGGEVILFGEVDSSVNSYISRQGHDFNAPEVLAQREALIRSRLNQLIEQRAVLHEARRTIPADALKSAIARFDEDFDKTIVPQMLKERKLTEVAALEEALKKEGTTLDRTRRDFAETILFKSWLQQRVDFSRQVTHEEMLDHYQKHLSQYEFAGECRWEQLSARFDKFGSKAEAYTNIAHWGNQVIIGQPWAEVARAHSQGSTASQGGTFDWTKKGSLVSKPIDEAIFALPVGTMSPIIEDDKGFHIVRVVERKDGGRTPFTEAQGAIKKKIMEERSELARKDYVAKVRKNAIVWNAFDDPATAPKFIAGPPTAAPMRR